VCILLHAIFALALVAAIVGLLIALKTKRFPSRYHQWRIARDDRPMTYWALVGLYVVWIAVMGWGLMNVQLAAQ
jgi:hypothetical protein